MEDEKTSISRRVNSEKTKQSSESTQGHERSGALRRRKFLQGIGFVGLTDIRNLRRLKSNEDDRVQRIGRWTHTNPGEVQKGAFPEREPEYYTISREKWAEVETTDNGRRRVSDLLAKKYRPSMFSVGVTEITHNNIRQRAINVGYIIIKHPDGTTSKPDAPFEVFKRDVPDQVSGTAGRGTENETTRDNIPVRTLKMTDYPEAYYKYRYDSIPAGCYFSTEMDPAGNHRWATVGTPANKNSNGNPVLVTTGHTFDANNDGSPEVVDLHQDDPGWYDWVGNPYVVKSQTTDYDVAIVDVENDSRSSQKKIAANDGNAYDPIRGILSRQWFLDNIGAQIEKQGAATGRVDATVDTVGDTWVKVDADKSQKGDSGGPYFDGGCGFDSCDFWIGAIHRSTVNGLQKGTLMEPIENNEDVTV